MTDPKNVKPVSVHILDKDYLVACSVDEQDELVASARYLDRRMREIRDAGKVIGADRIAVMAALNIAHELLSREPRPEEPDASVATRLRGLQERIEEALCKARQLEL